MTKDEEKCRDLISKIYERHKNKVKISPAWLATEAMVSLDPRRETDPMIYASAHLQFCQWARGLCRDKWDPQDANLADQHDLFPELQKRYPTARFKGEVAEYVLLEHLSEIDRRFNINRLSTTGESFTRHSRALAEWCRLHPIAKASMG